MVISIDPTPRCIGRGERGLSHDALGKVWSGPSCRGPFWERGLYPMMHVNGETDVTEKNTFTPSPEWVVKLKKDSLSENQKFF